jgi:hypothetical protein
MADKIKNAEDRLLESLFSAEAIADDGFSERIVGKIRRRLWLRRLALPFAVAIGSAIAFKPAVAVFSVATQLLAAVPAEFVVSATNWIPSLQLVVTGGLLLAVAMFGLRILED